MPEQEQTARELWEMFEMLTNELMKSITREDIDQFLDLVRQRGVVVDRMKALAKDDFRGTEAADALIERIRPLELQITYKARAWLNKSRRNNSTVRAYDITGAIPSGGIMNRKY